MPSMKPTLFAAALLTAGAAHAAPPVITITTPAQFSGSKAIISGTATDTEESTGGGGTGGGTATVLGPGGVREVLYQYEGESKWRKTTVTAKGELTTTWIAEVSLKVGSTKRIYFMAVDKGGNDGAVVGRKFKRLKKGEGGDGGSTTNQPPTFSSPNRTNEIGTAVEINLSPTDPNGDTVTMTGSGFPTGLTMDSNGKITGRVTGPLGISTVTVKASDGKGGITEKSFTWTVTPRLTIDTIVNQTNQTNTSVNILAKGNGATGVTLTYSALGLPLGVTINNATGVISGVITASPNVYNSVVTVTDSNQTTASTSFTWTVTP